MQDRGIHPAASMKWIVATLPTYHIGTTTTTAGAQRMRLMIWGRVVGMSVTPQYHRFVKSVQTGGGVPGCG